MRHAAKIDKNQPEIVAYLRKRGVAVQPMHGVGGGFPDLLCYYRGIYSLLEVKDETGKATAKYRDERCLTPKQKEFHAEWPGPIAIVWTAEEAWEAAQTPKVREID